MPEVTWERVEKRRKAYTPWKEQTLKIDTANKLKTNVEKVVQYIQGYGKREATMTDDAIELRHELETFFKAYEKAANSRDFTNVTPFIADAAVFWFTNGEFKGKPAIQKAFEDTYTSIQDEIYTISDIEWIASNYWVAACMYNFKSDGLVNGKRQVYGGKGTNVLRRIDGSWQIVHEHLSKASL